MNRKSEINKILLENRLEKLFYLLVFIRITESLDSQKVKSI